MWDLNLNDFDRLAVQDEDTGIPPLPPLDHGRICKRCCHRSFEPPRVCVKCVTLNAPFHCGPGCETCMEPCAECQQMVCGIHSSIVPDGRLCDVCRGGL